MLYFRCPTCGTCLANKQLVYENEINAICNNTKLSETERDIEKMKILDKIKLHNYCCRMRMLTYLKLIDTLIYNP